jgi:hypothetical protein
MKTLLLPRIREVPVSVIGREPVNLHKGPREFPQAPYENACIVLQNRPLSFYYSFIPFHCLNDSNVHRTIGSDNDTFNLYMGGTGCECWQGYQLPNVFFVCLFIQLVQANEGNYLKQDPTVICKLYNVVKPSIILLLLETI